MRIVLANLQRDYGGAEIHVRMLARGLHRRGHEVILLCHPEGRLRTNAEQDGVPTDPLLVRNQLDPLAIPRFVSRLRHHRPDILHLHTPKEYLAGTLAARLTCTFVVLTRHMLLPLKPLMRLLYARANAVICLSRGLHILLRNQGLPDKRLRLVHGAIDTEPFIAASHLPAPDIAAIRAEWGARPGEVLIGCVGRMVGGKGQEILLRAFDPHLLASRTLFSESPPVRLVLVGDGPERADLESMATTLNITDRVHFAGFRSDIPSVLAALDIVVVPSTAAELFPLSVLEAMATGRPVVASQVGGVPEIVSEPRLGRLVPSADPISLATTLSTLVNDTDLRQSMGIAAANHIQSHFTLPRFLDETEAIYRQAKGDQI